MYIASILAFMVVLPLASIFVEHRVQGGAPGAELALRWFVFWAVGVRLFVAGVRQIVQPAYTAESILGIQAPGALFFVRELGFANVALGAVALATLTMRPWAVPIALVAAIFYGLAGLMHVLHGERNTLQNVAMASDLYIAILLAACAAMALRPR